MQCLLKMNLSDKFDISCTAQKIGQISNVIHCNISKSTFLKGIWLYNLTVFCFKSFHL